ncbi:TFIIB-type zinc ribbon-containing protein [Lysinibacillus sp. NPDC094177]|uniref:TFIIB-type zinc ribbon-containing protein n=1 Tax=Lysinibacillus sp. NPDC094177 TaxID=3390580 RepID=UPI003D008A18
MTHLNIEISIPSDKDGFCLLQCPLCSGFFKLKPQDVEAEDVIQIWCPNCGIKSDNYLTEDVIELALNIGENMIDDALFDSFNKVKKSNHNKNVSVKVKEPSHKHENPIVAGIELLDIQKYKCCQREAKIKPIVKLIGSYCPFCGVNDDGNH